MSVPIQNQPTVRFSVPIQHSASSRPDQSSVPDAGVHLGPAHAGDLGRSSAGLRLGRASILFFGPGRGRAPTPPFSGGRSS
jgi:hypothetical protein